MKKKILIAGGVVLAVFVIAVAGLSVFAKSYLTSEKLKALVVPLVEEFTGAEADVRVIEVSIFRGIRLKGITLREPSGSDELIGVDEFRISYRLLPLLKKQLVIKKMEVLSPTIRVVRFENGEFNFSRLMDHIEKRKTDKESRDVPEGTHGETRLPVSLVTDRIVVRDFRVAFTDRNKMIPDVTSESDIELKISADEALSDIDMSGNVNLKSLKVSFNGVETVTSGTMEIDKESILIGLKTVIGTDTLTTKGTVQEYLANPEIRLDGHADELDLQRLMALADWRIGNGNARESGPKKKNAQDSSTLNKIKASGELNVDKGKYPGVTMSNIHMEYEYSNGVMNFKPISMELTGGDKITAQGPFSGEMSFGLDPEGRSYAAYAKKTLKGKGKVELGIGEIRGSKILNSIAVFTGIENLKNFIFKKALFHFDMKDQKVSLD